MSRPLPVLEPASSLTSDGRRNFVVPADVEGRFVTRRRVVFAILALVYALLPWIEIGGHPAVFLDVDRRAFYLFGATFNSQDFWLAFFLFSGIGFALILATALAGRVWCGYACPQTVFLEGAFRRVERWIEGSRAARAKRDRGGWTANRVARKVAKHTAFIVLSLLIAHIALSYFVSIPAVFEMVRQRPAEHPEAFAWTFAITGALYFNYSWFREQLCLIICPYGRLQSVLTDHDTWLIGYDTKRGEPRGKAKQKDAGDCVDCNRCVVVCPTGIDIRNGLQIDCIGCAACVDACDEVMTRLKRPTGLVRYDTLRGLEGEKRRFFRPRLLLYGGLGLLGLIVATTFISGREPFEANLLRMGGIPYAIDGDRVRNTVQLHLINKTGAAATFRVTALPEAEMTYEVTMPAVHLEPMGSTRVPVLVTAPRDGKKRHLKLKVDGGDEMRIIDTPFVSP